MLELGLFWFGVLLLEVALILLFLDAFQNKKKLWQLQD